MTLSIWESITSCNTSTNLGITQGSYLWTSAQPSMPSCLTFSQTNWHSSLCPPPSVSGSPASEFSERWAGRASIPLRWCCSLTTCLLLGSSCPAHASPSVSADRSEPTQEGRSPPCRVASRRGLPGDLCMTPQTCCLSVLAHGVPVCPAGRIDRSDTLLDFLDCWCAGPSPPRIKERRSVCLRTALPSPCWKRLSWQPSFCVPCLRSRLALARGDPSNGPGLIHKPKSPLRGGVRGGALYFSQNWMGHMWSRPNWSTGETAAIRDGLPGLGPRDKRLKRL